jgi:hypothetical protein
MSPGTLVVRWNLETTMPAPDPHGQVALMLCESLLHVLVEQHVITQEKAIEAIDGIAELTREMPEARTRRMPRTSPVELIDRIRESFAAKD